MVFILKISNLTLQNINFLLAKLDFKDNHLEH